MLAVGKPSEVISGSSQRSSVRRTASGGLARARLYSRTLLLSLALLFAAASNAQAQVVISDLSTKGAAGASSVDITGVNTTGSNTALVVAVCLNNNNFETASTVVLDPGGGNQTSLTWLDNAVGIYQDDGYCAIFGVTNPPSGKIGRAHV